MGDTEAFSFLMSQSRVNPIVSKNDMQSLRGRRHFYIEISSFLFNLEDSFQTILGDELAALHLKAFPGSL